jgi:acylphosphatase
MTRVRRRVILSGLVQGVFFRDSTRRVAKAAGVAGWVRNRQDGAVEVVLEGNADAVQRLVDFCSIGPRGAQVDEVEVHDEPPQGLAGFHVRS